MSWHVLKVDLNSGRWMPKLVSIKSYAALTSQISARYHWSVARRLIRIPFSLRHQNLRNLTFKQECYLSNTVQKGAVLSFHFRPFSCLGFIVANSQDYVQYVLPRGALPAVCSRKDSPFGSTTRSAVGSRQSAVGSQQSAVGSRQSAVGSRQSAVGSPVQVEMELVA